MINVCINRRWPLALMLLFVLVRMSQGQCIDPGWALYGEGAMTGEATQTLFLKHLRNSDREISSGTEALVVDLITTSPEHAMAWATDILTREDCTAPTLHGLIATVVLPAREQCQLEQMPFRDYLWVLTGKTFYEAPIPFPPPPKPGTLDHRHGMVFLQQPSDEILNELEERIRKALLGPEEVDDRERRMSWFLLRGYLNRRPDAGLIQDLWTSSPAYQKEGLLQMLRGARCVELADVATSLAINLLETPELLYTPTLVLPTDGNNPPEGLSKRVPVRILAEYADRPVARDYIFRKLDRDPFAFFPDEEVILRRVTQDFELEVHEKVVLSCLKQLLARDLNLLQNIESRQVLFDRFDRGRP